MSPLMNSSAGRRRARSSQGRLPAGPLQGSAWKFRVDCLNLRVVRVDYTPARSREFTYKESIHFFRLNRDIAAPRRRVSWFVWVFRVGFCAGVGRTLGGRFRTSPSSARKTSAAAAQLAEKRY